MIQLAGTIVVIIGILVLFALDRDRDATQVSKALWIPSVWLFLVCSRPVSLWLQMRMIGTSADDLLEGSPLDRNAMILLIAAALIILIIRAPKLTALLRRNLPMLLFLFYCGVSIFWSDFPDVAAKRWMRALGDVAMVLVVATEPQPDAAVETLLARMGLIVFPLSIVVDFGRARAGLDYHAGLTTDKNMFGMVCLVLGLAAVWRLFKTVSYDQAEGRGKRILVRAVIALMATWCIWTGKSGTSTACFFVGVFLIVVAKRWLSRKPVILHLVVVSLVFLALYAAILNPDMGVVSAMGKDPTLTGRTDVWKTVIAMAPNPLVGAGFESFWLGPRLKKLWDIYVWRPNEAHDGYIEVYLNLGWMGLCLLGFFLITSYWRVAKGLREKADIGRLRFTYVVIAIIYSLTEAGFRMFSAVWLAFLLSAAAVLASKSRAEVPSPPAPPPPPPPKINLAGRKTVALPARSFAER